MDNFSTTEQKSNFSEDSSSPVRRPMNAFLIFCKHHRGIVREKNPHLENRAITKLLGEWWTKLEQSEKSLYTDLAKQYKDAFMKAHPDFKWYKLPASRAKRFITRPSSRYNLKKIVDCGITLGKLVDDEQLGGLSSLIKTSVTPKYSSMDSKEAANFAMPLKKRYIINGEFQCSSEVHSAIDRDYQTRNACSALLELGEIPSGNVCDEVVFDSCKVPDSHAIRKDNEFCVMEPSNVLPVKLEVSSNTDSEESMCIQTEEMQQDQPLDLCKNKNGVLHDTSRYIKTSHQHLINHFVDKFLNNAPAPQESINESKIIHPTFCQLFSDEKFSASSSKYNEIKQPAFPLSAAIESTIDKAYSKDSFVLNKVQIPESDILLDYMVSNDEELEKDEMTSKNSNLSALSEPDLKGFMQSSAIEQKVESLNPSSSVDVKSTFSNISMLQKSSLKFNNSKYKTFPSPFKKSKVWCNIFKNEQVTKHSTNHKVVPGAMLPSRRNSQRTCKGRRYQAFLTEGFLLSHKRRKQSIKPKHSVSKVKNVMLSAPKTHAYFKEKN